MARPRKQPDPPERRRYGAWSIDFLKARSLWRVRPPRSVDPKRRPHYERTQQEAQAWALAEQTRIAGGAEVSATDLTLGDYLDWWIETNAVPRRWSAATVRLYRAHARRFGDELLGQPLRLLTRQMIQARVNELLTAGPRIYKAPPERRPLSANSVLGTVRTWRAGLDDAVEEYDLIPESPAARLILPEPDRDEADSWTAREAETLARAIHGHRHEVILSLMLGGAFRIGEALAFRWTDVDWDASRIWAHATGTRGIQEQTKTRRRRWVPLPPHVLQVLEEHRKSQDWLAEFISEWQPGQRWSYTAVRKDLRALCLKIGITPYGTHAARHHAASRMSERGMPLAAISKVLGHSTPGITARRYLHPSDEALSQAATILADVFPAPGSTTEGVSVAETP